MIHRRFRANSRTQSVLLALGASLCLALPAWAQGGVDPQPTGGSPGPSGPLPSPTSQVDFLDPGFGDQGIAAIQFGGDRSAMALQPDGRIVMVGGTFVDFIMARFDAGGSLDPTFGDAGQVTTDMIPDQQEEALAVAVQPDGAIVVAGYSGFDPVIALARYAPDGSLDAAFGDGGRVTGPVSGRGYAVAVQPDGAIVVAGEVVVAGSDTDYADLRLVRYMADGTLDASFGVDGAVSTDLGTGTNAARNVALYPDGRILVSGEGYGVSDLSNHTDMARYAPDGSLDTSFGDGGTLTLGGLRLGEGLALQDDGGIVLAGAVDVGGSSRFGVMRLDANGRPDETFGDEGMARVDFEREGEMATAVTLDAEGRIVVAGRAGNINTDFAAARLDTNGQLDASFAADGLVTVDFFYLTDVAESVAVQPDGMVVLGGLAVHAFDGYGLARVRP
jgi:uncharacterized delta-60 repeat protein